MAETDAPKAPEPLVELAALDHGLEDRARAGGRWAATAVIVAAAVTLGAAAWHNPGRETASVRGNTDSSVVAATPDPLSSATPAPTSRERSSRSPTPDGGRRDKRRRTPRQQRHARRERAPVPTPPTPVVAPSATASQSAVAAPTTAPKPARAEFTEEFF